MKCNCSKLAHGKRISLCAFFMKVLMLLLLLLLLLMMMMMMMSTQYTLVLISVVDDSGNDICCWCLKFGSFLLPIFPLLLIAKNWRMNILFRTSTRTRLKVVPWAAVATFKLPKEISPIVGTSTKRPSSACYTSFIGFILRIWWTKKQSR